MQSNVSKQKYHSSKLAIWLGIVAGFALLIGVGAGSGALPPERIVPVVLLSLIGIGATTIPLLCE